MFASDQLHNTNITKTFLADKSFVHIFTKKLFLFIILYTCHTIKVEVLLIISKKGCHPHEKSHCHQSALPDFRIVLSAIARDYACHPVICILPHSLPVFPCFHLWTSL
ncbi:hypothetical protein CYL18_08960 [Pradoshia eiseniae]|uniref:Uncharacterized protein n=1 Tax=Pradoshia eiseniae TaxID=2064768 RepID=A0A2S7N063_9BACI|nr:hypothetical protein CYL18_08960 [Pradoshia eiseniae]